MKQDKNYQIKNAFQSIGHSFTFLGHTFQKGDALTKLSYVFMGASNLFRGQIIKGLLFLLTELAFIFYMVITGAKALSGMITLGDTKQGWVYDEALGIDILQDGDNSMLILLFGVLAIFVIIAFVMMWTANIKSAITAQQLKTDGKPLPTFMDDLKQHLDSKLQKTLLAFPLIGIISFTLLPLVFMILVAFTNFDSTHQPPGNLFTWVGLDNFKIMLGSGSAIGKTFWPVLGWTLIWAVAATFTTYIGGILLALLINKKNVKYKAFWRTMFVISIAVPQFVTLLTMKTLLQDEGAINVLLKDLGLITQSIPFWKSANLARMTIIVINLWIGIPFTMLTVTGILMNVPGELYEAAKVDGANSFIIFLKITLPYVLFITTPTLITGFIGNINNFNVIFLLNSGGPANLEYFQAGKTDLLVTWLYRLTTTGKEYSYASTIGILVFVISAVFSLLAYRKTAAYKEEGDFS